MSLRTACSKLSDLLSKELNPSSSPVKVLVLVPVLVNMEEEQEKAALPVIRLERLVEPERDLVVLKKLVIRNMVGENQHLQQIYCHHRDHLLPE